MASSGFFIFQRKLGHDYPQHLNSMVISVLGFVLYIIGHMIKMAFSADGSFWNLFAAGLFLEMVVIS